MKIILHLALTCFMLMPGILSVSAQPQDLWPASNATWKVVRTMPFALLQQVSPMQVDYIWGTLTTDLTYTLGGDTIIGGIHYTKLQRNQQSTYTAMYIDSTVIYPSYDVMRGAFRTARTKVFFWNAGDMSEHFLYDFDLQEGDTLPPAYNNHLTDVVVDQIDTIMIAGLPHRKFYLSGVGIYGDVLIEGIGSNHGPIEELGLGIEINHALRCFGRNNVTVYPDTGTLCGPSAVGQQEIPTFYSPLTVTPNPVREIAKISSSKKNKMVYFQLYDLQGRLCREATIDVQNHESFQLEKKQIPNGTYMLVVDYDNGDQGFVTLVFQ